MNLVTNVTFCGRLPLDKCISDHCCVLKELVSNKFVLLMLFDLGSLILDLLEGNLL